MKTSKFSILTLSICFLVVALWSKIQCADKAVYEYPPELICPITHEVMNDPVVIEDGFSCERDAINEWFSQHDTSPMTNAPIVNHILIPNNNLRILRNEWGDRVESAAQNRIESIREEIIRDTLQRASEEIRDHITSEVRRQLEEENRNNNPRTHINQPNQTSEEDREEFVDPCPLGMICHYIRRLPCFKKSRSVQAINHN